MILKGYFSKSNGPDGLLEPVAEWLRTYGTQGEIVDDMLPYLRQKGTVAPAMSGGMLIETFKVTNQQWQGLTVRSPGVDSWYWRAKPGTYDALSIRKQDADRLARQYSVLFAIEAELVPGNATSVYWPMFLGYIEERNFIYYAPRTKTILCPPALEAEIGGWIVERLEMYRDFYKINQRIAGQKPKKEIPVTNCTVGTDAEYVIADVKLQILHSPTEFFTDTQTGAIGTDGNVELLELRPSPHKNPLRVAASLASLLREVHKILPPGLDLMGGGGLEYGASTGTHIHFSDLPFEASDRKAFKIDKTNGESVLSWLVALIYDPMALVCTSWKRSDPHYGIATDYRSQANHGEFPHDGFEWRALPQVFINPSLTAAILCTAKCVVDTYCSDKEFKVASPADVPKILRQLTGYDKHKKFIEKFIAAVESPIELGVPILASFFKHSTEKDDECDIRVIFDADHDDRLSVRSYIGYSPQKITDAIIIYHTMKPEVRLSYVGYSEREEQSRILHRKLSRFFLREHGFQVTEIQPQTSYVRRQAGAVRRAITIGLPGKFVTELVSRNRGSRNGVKMFSQEVLKEVW